MASDTDAKALGEALRSEYSAIFGYGVVSAYVSDTYNSSVATVWSAHRARRDRIIHIIESSDEDLPQPEVAYTSTKKVWDSLTAMQLAARIEDDCSIAWVNALQQCSTPDGRHLAMRALLHTAEWTARWRIAAGTTPSVDAFPGLHRSKGKDLHEVDPGAQPSPTLPTISSHSTTTSPENDRTVLSTPSSTTMMSSTMTPSNKVSPSSLSDR